MALGRSQWGGSLACLNRLLASLDGWGRLIALLLLLSFAYLAEPILHFSPFLLGLLGASLHVFGAGNDSFLAFTGAFKPHNVQVSSLAASRRRASHLVSVAATVAICIRYPCRTAFRLLNARRNALRGLRGGFLGRLSHPICYGLLGPRYGARQGHASAPLKLSAE